MAQLMKLVWGGKLGTTESWSCSLHGMADDGAGPSVGVTVAPAVSTFHTSGSTGVSSAAFLDFIKLNFVDATDHYVTPDLPNRFDVIPAVVGISAPLPFQCAKAVTLLTAAPRGKASKGRFYIPAGSPGVIDQDGHTTVVAAQATATAATTFLAALKAGGFQPVVYSVAGATGRPITRVTVGRVIDTQRRRRRSLTEAYVDGALI